MKFEIGHVLFIDIVGYSKLNIHEQSKIAEQALTQQPQPPQAGMMPEGMPTPEPPMPRNSRKNLMQAEMLR